MPCSDHEGPARSATRLAPSQHLIRLNPGQEALLSLAESREPMSPASSSACVWLLVDPHRCNRFSFLHYISVSPSTYDAFCAHVNTLRRRAPDPTPTLVSLVSSLTCELTGLVPHQESSRGRTKHQRDGGEAVEAVEELLEWAIDQSALTQAKDSVEDAVRIKIQGTVSIGCRATDELRWPSYRLVSFSLPPSPSSLTHPRHSTLPHKLPTRSPTLPSPSSSPTYPSSVTLQATPPTRSPAA